jgi:hypothetical protein
MQWGRTAVYYSDEKPMPLFTNSKYSLSKILISTDRKVFQTDISLVFRSDTLLFMQLEMLS